MTWRSAKEYCESLGGHLVTINSDEEAKLVSDMLNAAGAGFTWVGGTGVNRNWQWITDEVFSRTVRDLYFTYRYEFFNYDNGKIFYLMMDSNANNLSQRNICGTSERGYNALPFICEWEPVSTDFVPFLSTDDEAYINGEDFSGYLEDPRDLSNLMSDPPRVSIPVTLPAAFDPRTSGRSLPAVRDQGTYGTCWSFASIGALETSYMTKFGKTVDLSELHQAWFVFKDPREGYAQALRDRSKHVLSQGGYASDSVHFPLRHRPNVRKQSHLRQLYNLKH